nr:high molecular weight protein 1, HMW1=cytadherence-acessory protein [Mycoplasma pneumoniae, Peptide Partial, 7 aa] [Mycoplasmoides pneumoniae]
VAEPSYE